VSLPVSADAAFTPTNGPSNEIESARKKKAIHRQTHTTTDNKPNQANKQRTTRIIIAIVCLDSNDLWFGAASGGHRRRRRF
jgi:hypothetical protein